MKAKLNYFFLLSLVGLLITGCKEKTTLAGYSKLNADTMNVASNLMQSYIDDGKLSCISTLAILNGEVVFESTFGLADIEKNVPLTKDHIFRIYSMSKPVTAVALMILYDEGKFQLDDPVSKYIPEFAKTEVFIADADPIIVDPQEQEMTIRHLLTHTAGFTYGWDPYSYVDSVYQSESKLLWGASSLEDAVDVLSGIYLKYQPGTRWEYSVSIDVAGYLVEVLSGQTLDVFMQEHIFKPLKMKDTGFQVAEKDFDRLAMIYTTDYENAKVLKPINEAVEGVKSEVKLFSGGAGLVSTIGDYARFAQMLLNKGELDGIRILEESTVELIMSDQLPEGVDYAEGMGYGLGGSVHIESGTYAWAGAASTFFWVDPSRNLLCFAFAQYMPNEKYPFAREFKQLVENALE